MKFKEQLQQHGIELTPIQEKQFADYATLLVEWNQKMNLTAITKLDEIYEKHFYDSVLPFIKKKPKGSLCDVGAGAGFPSIPVKILFPEIKVVIVETLNKRITFLQELCNVLKIDGVELVHARAEEYAQTHREFYDIVSARAVANFQMLSELCIPMVKVGGTFIAMKGSNGYEEEKLALHALHTLGCERESVDEEVLSDGATRLNFFYKKIKKTPKAYPRAFAQIKKQPL